MRIEKYNGSGKVIRRINTTKVMLDGDDSIPANLSVQGLRGGTTEKRRRTSLMSVVWNIPFARSETYWSRPNSDIGGPNLL